MAADDAKEAFDLAKALERHRYDPILLCDIAETFIDTSLEVLTKLRVALEQGNLQQVLKLTGRLKAGLIVLCAEAAAAAAGGLEVAADKGHLSEAQRCLTLLHRRVEDLVPALQVVLVDPVRRAPVSWARLRAVTGRAVSSIRLKAASEVLSEVLDGGDDD